MSDKSSLDTCYRVNGTDVLRIGELSAILRVTPERLRQMEREGSLVQSERTLGGTRFWKRSTLEKAGILTPIPRDETPSNGETKNGRKVYRFILYVRCSSPKQTNAGSLERQKERMLAWIKEQYGIDEDDILVLMETKSAFAKRTQLIRILELCLSSNGPETVFVEYPDRWSRATDSEWSILQFILDRSNTKLVFAKKSIDDDDPESQSMASELLGIITYFSNKASAAKSRAVTQIIVPENHLNRMVELYKNGFRWKAIARQMKTEGFLSSKNRDYHWAFIAKTLKEYFRKNPIPKTEKKRNMAIEEFVRREITIGKSYKVFSSVLWEAFKAFNESNGYPYLPMKSFYRLIQSDWNTTIKPSTKGNNAVFGMKFKRKEWASASTFPAKENPNHLKEIAETIRKSFS